MLWPVDKWDFKVRSSRAFGMLRRFDALLAQRYTLEAAHHANESATAIARIAFGSALLVATSAADHRVLLAKIAHSESPGSEEVKTQLPRRLLLNLRSVSRAGDVARTRLDTRLCSVDRIEPILNLQSEIVAEIVGVYEAQSGAETDEPVIANLLSNDGA
jgi:hypothetical protein